MKSHAGYSRFFLMVQRSMAGLLFALLSLSTFLLDSQSLAANTELTAFVQVRPDKQLWVEYSRPAPGKPTVVLINGLTYSTRQWKRMAAELVHRGYGVLKYDPDGMGRTLLRYGPAFASFPIATQVSDLHKLLLQLKIPAPYNLVGLSYGGGLGIGFATKFPREVKNLILMAPYTRPLDAQDVWIRRQIAWARMMFPANPASDDDLYDFYLRQIVYSSYPALEPVVLENPYKLEATFRLVQGIRHFRPENYASRLNTNVHLVLAGKDQYIPAQVLEDFWSKTPRNARKSRILVTGSEHKIPEDVPAFAAGWVAEILNGNPALFQGRDFVGDPAKSSAKSGGVVIKLPRGL